MTKRIQSPNPSGMREDHSAPVPTTVPHVPTASYERPLKYGREESGLRHGGGHHDETDFSTYYRTGRSR